MLTPDGFRVCRICDRCGCAQALSGERFCQARRKAVKLEMQTSGFLQRKPGHGKYLDRDAREKPWETRHEG